MRRQLIVIIVSLVFIVSGHQGHGSHRHMEKRHDHYVPKVIKLGEPVQSVLEERQMIHDTEWVFNLT